MTRFPIDAYVVDTLMRDIVGHSRKASPFLVYLFLWRQTHGAGRPTAAFSHQVMAESTGLSKRSVQNAVAVLARRGLIRSQKRHRTAIPKYTVLRPWIR